MPSPSQQMLTALTCVDEGRITKICRGPANILECDGERILSLELRKAERKGWVRDGIGVGDDIGRKSVTLTPEGEMVLDQWQTTRKTKPRKH